MFVNCVSIVSAFFLDTSIYIHSYKNGRVMYCNVRRTSRSRTIKACVFTDCFGEVGTSEIAVIKV